MPVKLRVNNINQQAMNTLHQIVISMNRCDYDFYNSVGVYPQQYYVLLAVKNLPDPVTFKSLAHWLDRNVNTITLIINRMETSGLVSKVRDGNDRRNLRITLTRKGNKALKQGGKYWEQVADSLMSVLSSDEVQTLSELLSKVLEKSYDMRELKAEEVEIK